ncbi:MAG: hypothetical protein K8S56_01575, partial [Candidatus Cloacimonetes bacterium]|nr:hypothetical protein [Candidatus Cloacimonadota bacterium]
TERNIQYINKFGVDLVNSDKKSILGKKCYDQFKTGDCSNNCALVKCMNSGKMEENEIDAHPAGRDLEIKYVGSPIRNLDKKIVGAMEVVIDQTAILNAQKLTEKVASYQGAEVEKLTNRLDLLSKGNLDFDTDIAKTDEDTEATGANFRQINKALGDVRRAVNRVIEDADMLTKATHDGKLSTRADAEANLGAFKNIITGVNELLEELLKPITEVMNVMGDIAGKTMTSRVTDIYKGDLNEFKQNVNNATDNLEDALTQVNTSVDQISGASGEIASGSQALAEGTSEQAASLEEVAASLEEMNSLTLNNAENAKQGSTLSQESLANVKMGNEAMGRMSTAMEAISKSTEQTGRIIKTIDEIAFQTNLLALNAAVEAAHAGEAGKGFAVVAEEVKNLALRSAEAAKNTNELIEGSLRNSNAGATIVTEVLKSFTEINSSFDKVNSIVQEIAAASDEQSQGIKQVNMAMEELNKLTQHSAANAEESAAAAEELSSQSAELKGMVSEFTLSNTSSNEIRQNIERRVEPRKITNGKKKPSDMYEVDPSKVLPLDEVDEGDFENF